MTMSHTLKVSLSPCAVMFPQVWKSWLQEQSLGNTVPTGGEWRCQLGAWVTDSKLCPLIREEGNAGKCGAELLSVLSCQLGGQCFSKMHNWFKVGSNVWAAEVDRLFMQAFSIISPSEADSSIACSCDHCKALNPWVDSDENIVFCASAPVVHDGKYRRCQPTARWKE